MRESEAYDHLVPGTYFKYLQIRAGECIWFDQYCVSQISKRSLFCSFDACHVRILMAPMMTRCHCCEVAKSLVVKAKAKSSVGKAKAKSSVGRAKAKSSVGTVKAKPSCLVTVDPKPPDGRANGKLPVGRAETKSSCLVKVKGKTNKPTKNTQL